jgi:methionyl-tRNA formyltransferase
MGGVKHKSNGIKESVLTYIKRVALSRILNENTKLTKEMGLLSPDTDTAEQTLRKIIAYEGYPKARYTLYGKSCLILRAHLSASGDTAPLIIKCADGHLIALDTVQPEGKRPMDAKSFLNGYANR